MSTPATVSHGATFWLVWSGLPFGSPTFAHATEESARTEAERLANLYPGACFHVLKTSASVRKTVFDWSDLARQPKPAPF